MVITTNTMEGISPYVVPGIKFEYMPSLDQEFKAETVIVKICDYFKIEVSVIKSKTRKQDIADIRHLCMWFVKVNTYLPLKKIGQIMGGRDHTTVISSLSVVKSFLSSKQDNKIKDYYYHLVKII